MKKLGKIKKANLNTIEYFSCWCAGCPCEDCGTCWYECGYNPEMVNIEHWYDFDEDNDLDIASIFDMEMGGHE